MQYDDDRAGVVDQRPGHRPENSGNRQNDGEKIQAKGEGQVALDGGHHAAGQCQQVWKLLYLVVHKRDELKKALEDVLSDKTVGIVLLTEKFGREFPDIIDTFRLERKMPLLVEIPDRHGTGRQKDFITSYITEAIGLKL